MIKSLLILFACFTLFCYSPVKAEAITKNDVELRDELILNLLFPSIDKEIKIHFGKPKQYYCEQILQIKKLEQGSYYFDVTLQVTTFNGAHNPPYDLVTIKFSNFRSPFWRTIDFKSRRLKPNEITKCRHPL